jgi:hypothetical protein
MAGSSGAAENAGSASSSLGVLPLFERVASARDVAIAPEDLLVMHKPPGAR